MPDPGTSDTDALGYNAALASKGPLAPARFQPHNQPQLGDRLKQQEAEDVANRQNVEHAADAGKGRAHQYQLAGDRYAMENVPEMSTTPPPEMKNTSPEQAWGSIAMLMAGIGGLRSRNHLTTALNAGAAVMNAYHQADVETYKNQMAQWKISNDNANKILNYQTRIYGDILRHMQAEGGQSLREASLDERTAIAMWNATRQSFGQQTGAINADTAGAREGRQEIEGEDRIEDRAWRRQHTEEKDAGTAARQNRRLDLEEKKQGFEREKFETSEKRRQAGEDRRAAESSARLAVQKQKLDFDKEKFESKKASDAQKQMDLHLKIQSNLQAQLEKRQKAAEDQMMKGYLHMSTTAAFKKWQQTPEGKMALAQVMQASQAPTGVDPRRGAATGQGGSNTGALLGMIKQFRIFAQRAEPDAVIGHGDGSPGDLKTAASIYARDHAHAPGFESSDAFKKWYKDIWAGQVWGRDDSLTAPPSGKLATMDDFMEAQRQKISLSEYLKRKSQGTLPTNRPEEKNSDGEPTSNIFGAPTSVKDPAGLGIQ